MWNRDLPLRYNLNPAIKASTARTAPITRVDFMGIADQLGLSPFRSDVWIVEYVGKTDYDGLNIALDRRFANNWGARVSYSYGHGRGNTSGLPTATNDFQVLSERNLELNEGPTNLDRRHTATVSGRFDVPWLHGLTGGAVLRMMSGQPFSIVNSNIDADRNNIPSDPAPPGRYEGVGENAISVDNDGGRNGAYGPGLLQLDLRAGYRLQPHAGRSVEFFAEVFNVTNEPNFANPTGDLRLGTFLVPNSLFGGGFPRQFQIGARFGF
jgi:hypothetical protein